MRVEEFEEEKDHNRIRIHDFAQGGHWVKHGESEGFVCQTCGNSAPRI